MTTWQILGTSLTDQGIDDEGVLEFLVPKH